MRSVSIMATVPDDLYDAVVEPFKKKRKLNKLIVSLLTGYLENDYINAYAEGKLDNLQKDQMRSLEESIKQMKGSLSSLSAMRDEAEGYMSQGQREMNLSGEEKGEGVTSPGSESTLGISEDKELRRDVDDLKKQTKEIYSEVSDMKKMLLKLNDTVNATGGQLMQGRVRLIEEQTKNRTVSSSDDSSYLESLINSHEENMPTERVSHAQSEEKNVSDEDYINQLISNMDEGDSDTSQGESEKTQREEKKSVLNPVTSRKEATGEVKPKKKLSVSEILKPPTEEEETRYDPLDDDFSLIPEGMEDDEEEVDEEETAKSEEEEYEEDQEYINSLLASLKQDN